MSADRAARLAAGAALALATALALTACRSPAASPLPPPPAPPPRDGPLPTPFALRSPAFAAGAAIPAEHTCDGRDVSPPLAWEGVPSGTMSLALVVEDPDGAEDASINWVVWGIPPSRRTLPAEAHPEGRMHLGRASAGHLGWRGPCPPPGAPHHYHFRLYALDVVPTVPEGADRLRLHASMLKHILAESVLIGTYARAGR